MGVACSHYTKSHHAVRTGIEPIFQEWKSYVLALRRTDLTQLKKPGLCGTGLCYREDPFIGIPGDKATVVGICFPCRSGHTYPHGYYEVPVLISAIWSSGLASRNKKPRNLLRGLCFIDIVIYLFNSRTCPATGIIPFGTKPRLCFYMYLHVAHV